MTRTLIPEIGCPLTKQQRTNLIRLIELDPISYSWIPDWSAKEDHDTAHLLLDALLAKDVAVFLCHVSLQVVKWP
jgi:hypothetical protein